MKIAKTILMGAVIADRRDGMKLKDIAEKYGIALGTVKNYLRESKVTLKAKAEVQKTKEERKAKALELAGEGMTRKEIANEMGLDYSTINLYFEEEIHSELPKGMPYKELGMAGRHKRIISEWAKKQPGRMLNTPEGDMIAAEAYEHIIVCMRNKGKMSAFPSGQLYYMNAR